MQISFHIPRILIKIIHSQLQHKMLFSCWFAKMHASIHAAAPVISLSLRCPYFVIDFFQMDICNLTITTPSQLRLFCKLRNKKATFPNERRCFFIILILPCIYLLNGAFGDTFRFCCICCCLLYTSPSPRD